jgi:hypothetical protein
MTANASPTGRVAGAACAAALLCAGLAAQSSTPSAPAPRQQQPTKSSADSGGAVSADLKDVSRHPDQYVGKRVTVEGEVTDVLGPHVFMVDARRFFHLWGGMLVIVPEPFAAIVQRDAPIRVTGSVERVVLAEAKKKWAFLNDPKIEVDLFEKPVIVATDVTTVAPTVVSLRFQADKPVGTGGANAANTITDVSQLAKAADSSTVGRRADLTGTVAKVESNGFWLAAPTGDQVFVMTPSAPTVRQSQSVTVQGTVLETPRRDRDSAGSGAPHRVYVYAERVAPK